MRGNLGLFFEHKVMDFKVNAMRTSEILIFFCLFFMGSSLMASPPLDAQSVESPLIQEELNPSSLLGFKEWKQTRVFKARYDLDAFKSPAEEIVEKSVEKPSGNSRQMELETVLGSNPSDPEDGSEDSKVDEESKNPVKAHPQFEARAEKLRQLEFNLEIAQGLTIHDYFALYLKDKSKQDMVKVIEKLSSEELSELLLAYRTSLYGLPVSVKDDKNKINQNL